MAFLLLYAYFDHFDHDDITDDHHQQSGCKQNLPDRILKQDREEPAVDYGKQQGEKTGIADRM